MSSQDRFQGRVKWFSNRLGYGFLTYQDGNEEKDMFAHFSRIVTKNDSQYKTLCVGEYVEFGTANVEGKEGVLQADNITGLNGGPILSENGFKVISNQQFYNNKKRNNNFNKNKTKNKKYEKKSN